MKKIIIIETIVSFVYENLIQHVEVDMETNYDIQLHVGYTVSETVILLNKFVIMWEKPYETQDAILM